MDRRDFLAATASATALGVAGCTQDPGDRAGPGDTKTSPGGSGPGAKPEGTDGVTETNTPEAETPAEADHGSSGGESGQAWGSGGTEDGVAYSFTTRSPRPGENRDVTDIDFDTEAGEVVVDGTISGDDACKRAELGSVEYDETAGSLAIDVETTDIERCEKGGAGAQALVGIDYEGTFAVDGELPSEVTVSHHGRGIASAAHGSSSASATARPTTTPE